MTARILVVDDVAPNRRLLEAKLQAEFYEVALAASGPEAIALAESWGPDVILLDVMMPEMDGYETCARLKGAPATSHIPVVMVTALVEQAERVRGLEAGADDFLSKPVDDATLMARLRALLRVKQVQDAWRLRAETARDLGFEPPPAPSDDVRGARALVLTVGQEGAGALAAVLGQDGVVAETARLEDAAVEVLGEGGYDLVVLALPTDGAVALRLASRLRALASTRDLPLLLVADPEQRALVLRGFDIGANDHVLRPVDPNELRARARNQIRRKRYQERLREDLDRSLELAVTDPLTGLRNRRYVQRHLDAVLRGADTAVMMVDVDRFKAINDQFGHGGGDEVLREVARRLRASLRAADVVGRFGGEEFLVVLAGGPAEYASAVAERLCRAIAAEPIRLADREIAVTVSIGLAKVASGLTAAEAVAAADAALYRAKKNGRDRVETAVATDFTRPAR